MSDFDIKLKEKTQYVEDIIYRFLPEEDNKQGIICEAMNYSVKAGGKRLRPMLMLETFKMFSDNEEIVYPLMSAIEFIHTYSLVHDDLPAMDNDKYRRGQLTTHAKYGEGLGVLAGDGLLNYAYETALSGIEDDSNAYLIAKAIKVLGTKAGIWGMVGGQTVDVISENKKIDIETINYIHKLKTAALIEASMMIGAILGGASQDKVDRIEQIANNIGIAFQIQDDILDVTGDEAVLGKPVLSDEKNNKTTYITLIGLEESQKTVEKLSNEAIEELKALGSGEFLIQLVNKLINRDR